MGLLSAAMMALGAGVACSGSSESAAAGSSVTVSRPPVSQSSVSQSSVSQSSVSQSPISQPPISQPSVAATTLSPVPASAESSVPFSGSVQQIYSTGDFVLVSGPLTYTVVMMPTTTVVNLRGQRVPQQYIAVSGTVEVTGILEDGRIIAQNVLVPTIKDDV